MKLIKNSKINTIKHFIQHIANGCKIESVKQINEKMIEFKLSTINYFDGLTTVYISENYNEREIRLALANKGLLTFNEVY